MKNKHEKINDAKNVIKKQIEFLEYLIQQLKRPEKSAIAFIAAWCIDRYLSEKLTEEVERIMLQDYIPKDNEDAQNKIDI